MYELVVISGKGGTGKTSITAAIASLANQPAICDADVDAADLHLLLAPRVRRQEDFKGGGLAGIDQEKCIQCGQCVELCRFGAISDDFRVDPIDCEGCGVCADLCPENAIDFPIQTCGQWFISDTRFGPMVHAKLGIAEENSGKLVTLIRKEAQELAGDKGHGLLITDGPPGVGCPVIASIGGASHLLIVTEPTVSGLHDMQRVAELANHFKVPASVCINKCDLNPDAAGAIAWNAESMGMAVIGQIPFDAAFTRAMIAGQTLMEHDAASKVAEGIRAMWQKLEQKIKAGAPKTAPISDKRIN